MLGDVLNRADHISRIAVRIVRELTPGIDPAFLSVILPDDPEFFVKVVMPVFFVSLHESFDVFFARRDG